MLILGEEVLKIRKAYSNRQSLEDKDSEELSYFRPKCDYSPSAL